MEVCLTVDLANEAEEKWIAHFDTRNPEKGFNLIRGGGHLPHRLLNGDYRLQPGFKEAASARSKAIWADPEKRANILAGTQEAIRKPDVRAKLSAAVTELWKDPEFRERNLKATAEGRTPEVLERLRRNWDDPEFRERCSIGTRAGNEARASKTHCKNGHPRTPENLDASRECKTCIAERRREARTACPKGHPYVEGGFVTTTDGRRDCLECRALRTGARPCTKCGQPKTRRSGGGKLRCGPCTDRRIADWKASKESVFSSNDQS